MLSPDSTARERPLSKRLSTTFNKFGQNVIRKEMINGSKNGFLKKTGGAREGANGARPVWPGAIKLPASHPSIHHSYSRYASAEADPCVMVYS